MTSFTQFCELLSILLLANVFVDLQFMFYLMLIYDLRFQPFSVPNKRRMQGIAYNGMGDCYRFMEEIE